MPEKANKRRVVAECKCTFEAPLKHRKDMITEACSLLRRRTNCAEEQIEEMISTPEDAIMELILCAVEDDSRCTRFGISFTGWSMEIGR